MGLDAAGKTTILYKLHIGEILSTVPTIGKASQRSSTTTLPVILMLDSSRLTKTFCRSHHCSKLLDIVPLYACLHADQH